MHNFRELKVWKESMQLAKAVYELSALFPKYERYGLTSQIRRSAVSIPSNIAEGAGRNSDKELVHFLSIALGSAFELETQLILSNMFGFLSDDDLVGLEIKLNEIQKMLYGFQQFIIKISNKSNI